MDYFAHFRNLKVFVVAALIIGHGAILSATPKPRVICPPGTLTQAEKRVGGIFDKGFQEAATVDNQAFIDHIANPAFDTAFLKVETVPKKEFNDVLGKEASDLITNLHEAQMLDAINANPLLRKSNVVPYTDFKTFAAALTTDPNGDQRVAKAVKAAYEDANQRWLGYMQKYEPELLEKLEKMGYGDPRKIFKGAYSGFGQTLDENAVAARGARYFEEKYGGSGLVNLNDVSADLLALKGSVEEGRQSLQSKFGRTGLFTSAGPEGVPTADSFNLLRKANLKTPEGKKVLQGKLQELIGGKPPLTAEDTDRLIKYYRELDVFSPELPPQVARPEFVIPENAKTMSIDFQGQGGRNLEENARQMAKSKNLSLRETVRNTRKGEQIATSQMRFGFQAEAENAIPASLGISKEEFAKRGGKIIVSGDDFLVIFPDKMSPTLKQRRQIVTRLGHPTQSGISPSTFRATYGATTRKEIDVLEKVQKQVVDGLKIPGVRTKDLIISVDLRRTSGAPRIDIFVGGNNVPPETKRILEQRLQEILSKDGNLQGYKPGSTWINPNGAWFLWKPNYPSVSVTVTILFINS
jgi:hypothetical protein